MLCAFKLLRFVSYTPFCRLFFVGTIAGRRLPVPLFKALRKFAGVVISGTLRNLSDRLPAANQLHCRLLQTIFFDISVNRHAIDLLEQLLQMGHRHLMLCCQLGKRYIPLPVGQQMIPQMVCQLGLFRGKIGIRSGFLRNTIQEHEQFQRL